MRKKVDRYVNSPKFIQRNRPLRSDHFSTYNFSPLLFINISIYPCIFLPFAVTILFLRFTIVVSCSKANDDRLTIPTLLFLFSYFFRFIYFLHFQTFVIHFLFFFYCYYLFSTDPSDKTSENYYMLSAFVMNVILKFFKFILRHFSEATLKYFIYL